MKKTFIFAVIFTLFSTTAAFGLNVNNPAPTFFLRDINDNNFYLSDYVGPKRKHKAKGLVISFFASWCKPCRNELPVLNSLVDEFDKQSVKTVIIGFNEGAEKVAELLNELRVDKPIILCDQYGKVGEKYGVRNLPMTFIIGSDGKIKDIIRGELPNIRKELRDRVARLLK